MNCKEAKDDFNILYTNSEFAMQLLNDNCVMLYPHQDKSKLYTSIKKFTVSFLISISSNNSFRTSYLTRDAFTNNFAIEFENIYVIIDCAILEQFSV